MSSKYPFIWSQLDPLWNSFADRDQVEALWQLYELSLESLVTHLVQIHQNKNIQTVTPFHTARHLHLEINDLQVAGDIGITPTYPYCYKFAGESTNVVYANRLQDKFANPLTILEFGEDFVVFRGHIYFKAPPTLRRFYCDTCYKDLQILYNNYGALLGYKQTNSSYQYLYELQSLWYAVWRAPTPAIMTDALSVLMGAPFAEAETIVTNITSTRIYLQTGRVVIIPPGAIPTVYRGQKVRRFQSLTNAIVISDHVNAPFWWRTRSSGSGVAPESYFGEDGITADISDLNTAQLEDAIRRFHIFNIKIHMEISAAVTSKLQAAQIWIKRLKPTYVDYLLRVDLSFSNLYDQNNPGEITPGGPGDPAGPTDPDNPPTPPGELPPPTGPGGGGGSIVVPPGEEFPEVTPGGTSIFDRVPIIDYSLEFTASTINIEDKYFKFCTGNQYFFTNRHPDSGEYSYSNWLRRREVSEVVEVTPGYDYAILAQAGWVEYAATPGSFLTNDNLFTNGPATVIAHTETFPEVILPGEEITRYFWTITPAAATITNTASLTNSLNGYSAQVTAETEILPDHVIPGYTTTTQTTVALGAATNVGQLFVSAIHAPVYETIHVPATYTTVYYTDFESLAHKVVCDMRMECIDSEWWDMGIQSFFEDRYAVPDDHKYYYRNTLDKESQTNASLLTNTTLHTKGTLYSETPGFWDAVWENCGVRIAPVVTETELEVTATDHYTELKYLDFVGRAFTTNQTGCITNGRYPVWVDVPVKLSDDEFETRNYIAQEFTSGIRSNIEFVSNSAALTNSPSTVSVYYWSETVQVAWESWTTQKQLQWVDSDLCRTADLYCRTVTREDFLQIFEFEPGIEGSDLHEEVKFLKWCDPYAGITNAPTGTPIVTNRYLLESTEEQIEVTPPTITYELVFVGQNVYGIVNPHIPGARHVTTELVSPETTEQVLVSAAYDVFAWVSGSWRTNANFISNGNPRTPAQNPDTIIPGATYEVFDSEVTPAEPLTSNDELSLTNELRGFNVEITSETITEPDVVIPGEHYYILGAPFGGAVTNVGTLELTESYPDIYQTVTHPAVYRDVVSYTGHFTSNDSMVTNTLAATNVGQLYLAETQQPQYIEVVIPGIYETVIHQTPVSEVGGRTALFVCCNVLENYSELLTVLDPSLLVQDTRFYSGARECYTTLYTNLRHFRTNSDDRIWGACSQRNADTLFENVGDRHVVTPTEYVGDMYLIDNWIETALVNFFDQNIFIVTNEHQTVNSGYTYFTPDMLTYLSSRPPFEEFMVDASMTRDFENVGIPVSDYRYGFHLFTNGTPAGFGYTQELVSAAYSETILLSQAWTEYQISATNFVTNSNLISNNLARQQSVTTFPETVIPGVSHQEYSFAVIPAARLRSNTIGNLTNTKRGYSCQIVSNTVTSPDQILPGYSITETTLVAANTNSRTNVGWFETKTIHPADYQTINHPAVYVATRTHALTTSRTNNIDAKTNLSVDSTVDYEDVFILDPIIGGDDNAEHISDVIDFDNVESTFVEQLQDTYHASAVAADDPVTPRLYRTNVDMVTNGQLATTVQHPDIVIPGDTTAYFAWDIDHADTLNSNDLNYLTNALYGYSAAIVTTDIAGPEQIIPGELETILQVPVGGAISNGNRIELYNYLSSRAPDDSLRADILVPSIHSENYLGAFDTKAGFTLRTNGTPAGFENISELLVPDYQEQVLVAAAWNEYAPSNNAFITNSNFYSNGAARQLTSLADTIVPGNVIENYLWNITPAGSLYTNNPADITNELRGYSATVIMTATQEPDQIIPGGITQVLNPAAGARTNTGRFDLIATHPAVFTTVSHPAEYCVLARVAITSFRTNNPAARTNYTFSNVTDYDDTFIYPNTGDDIILDETVTSPDSATQPDSAVDSFRANILFGDDPITLSRYCTNDNLLTNDFAAGRGTFVDGRTTYVYTESGRVIEFTVIDELLENAVTEIYADASDAKLTITLQTNAAPANITWDSVMVTPEQLSEEIITPACVEYSLFGDYSATNINLVSNSVSVSNFGQLNSTIHPAVIQSVITPAIYRQVQNPAGNPNRTNNPAARTNFVLGTVEDFEDHDIAPTPSYEENPRDTMGWYVDAPTSVTGDADFNEVPDAFVDGGAMQTLPTAQIDGGDFGNSSWVDEIIV